MDASEYIAAVTEQMRCKKARAMVEKELQAHIEDQEQTYLEEGMEQDCAREQAVLQMGNPVSVGIEMDAIHRPRMDKRTLILIAVLSIGAYFLQTYVFRTHMVAGYLFPDHREILCQLLTGVAIMLGILYGDYTLLGKKPLVVWLVILVAGMVIPRFATGSAMIMSLQYLLMALFLPAYAGLIVSYSRMGVKGLIACILWLLIGLGVFVVGTSRVSLNATIGVSALLLLSYAIAKGYFHIRRILALVGMWLSLAALGIAFVGYVLHQGGYPSARLEAMLSLYRSPDSAGNHYITFRMREALEHMQLWGEGIELSSLPEEGAMSFFLILNRAGMGVGILLVAGLLILFCLMAAGVSKQKNILGSLVGAACILGLSLPTVVHLLSSLALINYTDLYLPFVYPGWLVNLSCYTLLGLYLSVYRNTDVVA